MLNRSAGQAGRHHYLDRGHDFYQTPERATNALLDVVDLSRRTVWEPCTGNGADVAGPDIVWICQNCHFDILTIEGVSS